MALKAHVASLDEVDKSFHSLYVPVGDKGEGGYTLDVDEKEYKTKLGEFRTNNIKLAKAQEELTAQMKQYEGIDPAKYKAAELALQKINEQEDAELLKAGKIDDVLNKRTSKMREEYDKQLQAMTNARNTSDEALKIAQGRLGQVVIESEVGKLLPDIGIVRKSAMQDVLGRAHQTFTVDENGNIKSNNKFNSKGEPLTLKDWGTQLLADAPHLFEPAQGGGAGGGQKKDTGNKNVREIDGNDPVAVGRASKDIIAGKAVVVNR